MPRNESNPSVRPAPKVTTAGNGTPAEPEAVATPQPGWTLNEARELYGVSAWGDGYFDIAEDGVVVVRPEGSAHAPAFSLMDVVEGLKARGLQLPVVIRFVDLLASRIGALNKSFQKAKREAGYQGGYKGVYPIKVNQQQHVVQEIMRFGRPYHYGLEAGSKAELIAALAYMDDSEALLVCNGYKDEEFIDLALNGLRMGFQAIIVLELPGELELVANRARAMGVRPKLGVRAKLSTRGGGHWQQSGGDRSMFGLQAAQIIDVIDRLRALGMLDCLHMLHFHLGSQIPNIGNIRAAVREAARFYVDLVKEGASVEYFDVGGGLAVDYDGSHSDSASSRNYDTDEYAADIVEVVMDVADKHGVPHPTIVTEAGRAAVAHHSVLLFNILDVTRFDYVAPAAPPSEEAPMPVRNLMEVEQFMTAKNLQECYHDAVYYRDEVRSAFEHGDLTLRERAEAERIYWHILNRLAVMLEGQRHVPEELKTLHDELADVYHGNFSLFQSLPDVWAIDQLFPIMPVHRLNEMPARRATLADITCDCDGAIDRFIGFRQSRRTLPVHELNGQDYYVGVFLVGAYQETLGDLHNLLGDTNVVGVRAGPGGEIEYDCEIDGDTVADVLSYVEYNPESMIERMRQTAESAVRAGRITPEVRRQIMAAYQDGLRGYTYFEN